MANKRKPLYHNDRIDFLSQFLKELRLNYGLTQKELAEEVGLHHNTIYHAENLHNMTVHSLIKLADFYGLEVFEYPQTPK